MSAQTLESTLVRVLAENGPAGVGFFVIRRHVFTCAHVVNYALGISGNAVEPPKKSVRMDLPFSCQSRCR
jgi:hypothetical protein